MRQFVAMIGVAAHNKQSQHKRKHSPFAPFLGSTHCPPHCPPPPPPPVLQSLSTFPKKISESNLKEVNALKNVGKGTMDRVSGD